MNRIRYRGSMLPDEELLADLHEHTIAQIPFENLDIQMGRQVSLRLDDIFDKIVSRGRGGYCYEINGLLQYVLRTIGVLVEPRAARTRFRSDGANYAKTHMLLVATCENVRWIVDAGFGAFGLTSPVPFVTGRVHARGEERYKLTQLSTSVYALQVLLRGEWSTLYDVVDVPCYPADFEVMNFFQANSPDSRFRSRAVVAKVRPFERTLLVDNVLKRLRNSGNDEIRHISDAAIYDATLKSEFGIDLGGMHHRIFSRFAGGGIPPPTTRQ